MANITNIISNNMIKQMSNDQTTKVSDHCIETVQVSVSPSYPRPPLRMHERRGISRVESSIIDYEEEMDAMFEADYQEFLEKLEEEKKEKEKEEEKKDQFIEPIEEKDDPNFIRPPEQDSYQPDEDDSDSDSDEGECHNCAGCLHCTDYEGYDGFDGYDN